MSIFYPHTVELQDQTSLEVYLADSVNVQRFPEMRRQILDGTFHRFAHPVTGRPFLVETAFLYTDLDRNTIIQVRPPKERHLWQQASGELRGTLAKIPERLSRPDGRHVRVVFGLGELREKLIAEDAGFDDRLVELLKVMVINDHPFLIQRPRLRLMLNAIDARQVEFIAAYDHDDDTFRVALPASAAGEVQRNTQSMQDWVARNHSQNLFALEDDDWVNYTRWSPQNWALRDLQAYDARLGAGQAIDFEAAEFQRMLRYLPRGNRLPSWAKLALRRLFDEVKARGPAALQDTLFEIRFGIEIEDEWAFNDDPDDIDTLWSLLRDLPDNNVEGNVNLGKLQLEAGRTGGWYEPGSGDIHIGSGELAHQERFQDVVRHEVGHAVHESMKAAVDPWLDRHFGWRVFDAGDDGQLDGWVGLMGGWGDLGENEREDVRRYLRLALGTGSSWSPGPTPTAPPSHPWRRPGFGPRLAFERTGAKWFNHNADWYVHEGKAFFLNYWYSKFMVVDAATLAFINADMPSRYAAMSPWEFFAELYALYYDLDDPMRDNIAPEAMRWLDENIGQAEPDAAVANDLGPAHRSGGTKA